MDEMKKANKALKKVKKILHKEEKKNKKRAVMFGKFDGINKFRHWWLGGISVSRSVFRVAAAWQAVGVMGALLIAGYIMAAFYTGSGEFVISLDRPMVDDGFMISPTNEFGDKLVTLHGEAVAKADNISIYDIDRTVASVDGSHNGVNYVAYTYYIKNATGETKSYQYQLQIKASEKGAQNATWVMIFQNDKQQIYAQSSTNGNPECQYSYSDFPFSKQAFDYESQVTKLTDDKPGYISKEVTEYLGIDSVNGIYQLETIPFESSDVICTNVRDNINDDEVDKYTVVIWLEGEDPECVDDILGGYVELAMKITY